jgi:hypothetical protein
VATHHIDILDYISLAFILYLYTIFLINLYLNSGRNALSIKSISLGKPQPGGYANLPTHNVSLGSPTLPNASSRPRRARDSYPGVLHDAEVYELGGVGGYYDEEDETSIVAGSR